MNYTPGHAAAENLDRTRTVYDRLAAVYPVSTFLFHSQAHRCALQMAGIRDGMQVLEVATGSGEMFRRLVGANRNGATVGIDISPTMAAHTHRRIRRKFPQARAAPAFWGRQVEHQVPSLLEAAKFRVVEERTLRQSFYPSRVLLARRA